MSFMEETLSNSFDFAQKVLHMREPQELAELQSEFVSRQAQVLMFSCLTKRSMAVL